MAARTLLVRSLMQLRAEKRTGVLSVTCQEQKTFVYLAAGVVVFAEDGSHGETLGRLLVRKGRLTQEQYVDVLGKMTDALVLNEQLRFGEVCVELGLLTEAEVRASLAEQVRSKVIRILLASEPAWSFEDSASRLEDVGRFPLSLEAVVLDAARWLDDEDKLTTGLARALEQSLVLRASQAEIVSRFALAEDEARWLRCFDGVRTGRELLQTEEGKAIDGEALLLALSITRAVEAPVARPATAPQAFTPAAGPRTTPQAFKPAGPLVRPTSPQAFKPAGPLVRPTSPQAFTPAGPVVRPTTPEAFTLARPVAEPPSSALGSPASRRGGSRASLILRALEVNRVKHDPTKVPENDEEAKLVAENAFQAGMLHAQAGRWAQAAPELQRASQLLPQSEEYRLHAKWAQVRSRSEGTPHALERAELTRIALAAIKADPRFAFGYYVAGNMAMLDGEASTAEKLLTRATKLDPSLLDAQRLLRVVERRSSKTEEGGILNKKLW